MVQLLLRRCYVQYQMWGKSLLIKANDKEAAIHRLKTEVRYNIKIFLLFFVVWVHSRQNE